MINSETAKSTYIVVAGRADYPIGFVYFMNTIDDTPQIIVYLNKMYTSPLVYGVDYTLSADGLNIVLTSPAAGDCLEIFRDVPFTQLSDYVIGRIDPDQIEHDFDLAVMRVQQAESEIARISEMPEDHEARIEELEYGVDNLESLVPTQATEYNKLADQNFVNSSIATSTATFRGTYSSLAELEAVTADDNDYGFVESVDSAGNTLYNRYKYTTATTPAGWAFEYALNNSSFTAAQWAAINSGITEDIVDNLSVATGRNVGDIFLTTRTDNGLNGAVECNGSQYNVTDFIGAQSIGELLADGKVPYVSLADYATALATNGVCGVYGWDGAGTTVFRVPSLTDVFIEAGTAAQIGDYLPAGLPNITASWNDRIGYYGGHTATGAVASTGVSDGTEANVSGTSYPAGYTFDASRSSSIYGNSNTVQPRAVRYRPMAQLAVSTTDEAVETCTGVLADVATLKGYDYVIDFQAPTAQNNYTWYRKYKSGWVEQGGRLTTAKDASFDIVLPVEMADNMYSLLYDYDTVGLQASTSGGELTGQRLSTTQIRINQGKDYGDAGVNWQVKGMAAQ